MKRILFLSILTFILVACGGDGSARAIYFLTTSASVTPQQNRVVMTIRRGGDYIADVESMGISARDPDQEVQWQGMAVLYADYATPYWVVYPQFERTGLWQLDIAAQTNDGDTLNGAVLIDVTETASNVTPGMAAPLSQTLTLDDGLPLLKMTTDATPNEDFYRLTVADAVTSGKPSLIVYATPGLCSSQICAPLLDTTIEHLYDLYSDRLNFVHVEIYDLKTSEYVPAMGEWGLSFDPWTFLVDDQGTIVSAYDGPLGVSEIQPEIEAVLAG